MEPTNQLMEAVLGGMLEGIVAIDRNTQVTLYNRAAAEIFSLPARQRIEPMRLIEVTRHPEINDAFRSVLDTGVPDRRRVEILRADRRRVFALHVNPIGPVSERNGTEGAAGVFFDITEIERLERVRRDFFANLSHELRTPLTSVLAYIETLLDGALEDPENNQRFLEIIQKHALRMQTLVHDITDLSMIESGEVSLHIEPLDLAAIVDEMVVLAGPRAEEAEVDLVNRVPRGFKVCADRYRLEQILNNLIDNAIKFNTAGGRVEISCDRQSDGAATVVVTDTGMGIAQSDLSRVFERFYRADRSRSRTREAGGSGLGLAIVKHLVHAHGARIEVESQQGRGSTFRVTFPACDGCV